jgi:hypothetical protein
MAAKALKSVMVALHSLRVAVCLKSLDATDLTTTLRIAHGEGVKARRIRDGGLEDQW